MAKDWAKGFYRSSAWLTTRASYISRRMSIDGGLCEECRSRLGYIVHHREHLTRQNINDPTIATAHDNLAYVCRPCHDKYDGHGRGRKRQRQRVADFDSDGQPIPRKKKRGR